MGSMQFNAIRLDIPPPTTAPAAFGADEKNRGKGKREELKLWGLTLGMTLDLIAYMTPATYNADYPRDELSGLGMSIAPSMT